MQRFHRSGGSFSETDRMDAIEQDLIDRISRGDQSAFGPLMDLHAGRIKRMISVRMDSRLRGRIDDSDIFQELQLDVIRRLPEYTEKRETSFFEWLRFLGRQKLAELSRRHVHTQSRDVRREERPGHHPDNDSSIALASFLVGEITSPSLQASRHEIRERLDAAIAGLEDSDREALLLRHAEQLSATEAATELGILPNAFRQRYFRALKRLKTVLLEQNLDWVSRDD